jgi:hypothetical protein
LSDRYRDPIVRKLGFVALLAVLAAPAVAAASTLQPKLLVLRKADVPRGYRVDETQLLGNPGSGATQSFRQLAKRSGRITGYYVHFVDGSKEITAVAELFRKPAGAKIYLAWYERRLRLQGEKARSRVASETRAGPTACIRPPTRRSCSGATAASSRACSRMR